MINGKKKATWWSHHYSCIFIYDSRVKTNISFYSSGLKIKVLFIFIQFGMKFYIYEGEGGI